MSQIETAFVLHRYVVIILTLCIFWQKTTPQPLFVTPSTEILSAAMCALLAFFTIKGLCGILALVQSLTCFSLYLNHFASVSHMKSTPYLAKKLFDLFIFHKNAPSEQGRLTAATAANIKPRSTFLYLLFTYGLIILIYDDTLPSHRVDTIPTWLCFQSHI